MHVRIRFVLLLCLLACGGCGKNKSTDELIADLKSSQERDRIIAVRLLPQRKGNAAQIVPALIDALKDKDGDVRRSAALGLGSFGEQAKDAIPALQAAQRGYVLESGRIALADSSAALLAITMPNVVPAIPRTRTVATAPAAKTCPL